LNWRVGKVIEREKRQWYSIVDQESATVFRINVRNIRKYYSPQVEQKDDAYEEVKLNNMSPIPVKPHVVEAIDDKEEEKRNDEEEPPEVDEIIAVQDETETQLYWITKVLAVEGQGVKLWYYGTTRTEKGKGKFTPVWIENGTGKSILAEKLKADEKGVPWTGFTPYMECPILKRNVVLLKSGMLSSKDRKALKDLTHVSMC